MRINLPKKRLEFLEDTIKFYTSKNRGFNEFTQTCQYSPIEGVSEGCAIGRHIPDLNITVKLDALGSIESVKEEGGWSLIPRKLRNLGVGFLFEVQSLHDGNGYWDEHGLTNEGKLRVDTIKRRFNLESSK